MKPTGLIIGLSEIETARQGLLKICTTEDTGDIEENPGALQWLGGL